MEYVVESNDNKIDGISVIMLFSALLNSKPSAADNYKIHIIRD